MPTARTNLLDLDRKAMEAFFQVLGHKAFHGRNVLKWIHKHGVTDFEAMTDLPKALRATLRDVAEVVVPEVVLEQPAVDGTRKWLLELADGQRIESVLIPDGTAPRSACRRRSAVPSTAASARQPGRGSIATFASVRSSPRSGWRGADRRAPSPTSC